MGPVAWCDHKNSAVVKFTRPYGQEIVQVLKNRCDWGINLLVKKESKEKSAMRKNITEE